MTEPYVKAGRGGAGNFYSKQELRDAGQAAVTNDLEANLTNGRLINDLTLTRTATTSQPLPDYQHTGRGGAGNWVEPKSLCAQGLVQEASPNPTSTASTTPSSSASISGTKRTAGQSKPTYRGGRGGAGNYTDFEADEKRRREEKERLRAEMEKRVEADIEAGLARPPRSYQGVGGAWEMGSLS